MARRSEDLAKHIEELEIKLMGVNARLDHILDRIGMAMEDSGAQVQED